MDSQLLGLKDIPAIAEPPHSQTNRKMVLEMKKQILSWTLSALLCLLLLPSIHYMSGSLASCRIRFRVTSERPSLTITRNSPQHYSLASHENYSHSHPQYKLILYFFTCQLPVSPGESKPVRLVLLTVMSSHNAWYETGPR